MIDLIHQICTDASCEPKDLVLEWTPTLGTRIIGTTPKGTRITMNILARLDHIAQAIWLCANGQEHLYPRIQEQQAAIDAQVKEWLGENAEKPVYEWDDAEDDEEADADDSTHVDWRRLKTVSEIMSAFPRHPSTDDIIDLYQRNKNFNSSDLKALLEKHSR